MNSSTPVAIAVGSNQGDRRGHLRSASEALRRSIADLRVSTFIETAPVPPGPHPCYLNAAIVGQTMLSPRALLDTLLQIELAHGRRRPYRNAPRTLDLDLILYGDVVVEEAGLIVPHPRFRERRFVLEPLAELAADWTDPVTGLTIRQLRDRLEPGDSTVAG